MRLVITICRYSHVTWKVPLKRKSIVLRFLFVYLSHFCHCIVMLISIFGQFCTD